MLAAVLAGVALSSLAMVRARNENEALRSLAEAERAFSKRCGQVGFRQSFLDNFAPDGIFYGPMPKNCHEDLAKLPAEPKPTFPPFEWAPSSADVSIAGDLGYSTGPVRYWSKDGTKPVGWGTYFSVWRREGKGPWKVVADLGLDAGGADLGDPTKVVFQPAPDFQSGRSPYPTANGIAEESLRLAESEFGKRASIVPYAQAVRDVGTANVRVHRSGRLPAVNSRKLRGALADWGKVLSWKTLGCGVARSGDFGYTYGKYDVERPADTPKGGYWLRVWKRDDGRWRLVADVANEA